MDYDSYFDPPDDGAELCPHCHRDIEVHERALHLVDGEQAWVCPTTEIEWTTRKRIQHRRMVLDSDVLRGSDADQALRDDADDYRLSQAGL